MGTDETVKNTTHFHLSDHNSNTSTVTPFFCYETVISAFRYNFLQSRKNNLWKEVQGHLKKYSCSFS